MFVHVKSINKFTLEKFGKKKFSFYFISFYSLVTLKITVNNEFTPNLLRSSLGPTPDSKSKCGDITDPADTYNLPPSFNSLLLSITDKLHTYYFLIFKQYLKGQY